MPHNPTVVYTVELRTTFRRHEESLVTHVASTFPKALAWVREKGLKENWLHPNPAARKRESFAICHEEVDDPDGLTGWLVYRVLGDGTEIDCRRPEDGYPE